MPLKKYLDYDGLAYLLQRFPKTTVHCTFDSEFAGETATLTHGTTTYTKTVPATSPYELTFAINELGTWTLNCSYLGTQYSGSVDITYLGQKGEIELGIVPDGSTIEPINSIPIWIKCANLNKNYSTLEEVLADTETYETLLADSNACQYMKRSTGWASAEGLVPEMTSATTPSGNVTTNSYYSDFYGWKAFDRTKSDGWMANYVTTRVDYGDWIKYDFGNSKIIRHFYLWQEGGHAVNLKAKIQASNDDSTWVDIHSFNIITAQNVDYSLDETFANDTPYRYWKLSLDSMYLTGQYSFGIRIFQFYSDADITHNQDAMARLGKFDYASNLLLSDSTWAEAIANSDYFESVFNITVPIMTSNTTPSGVVSADSYYSTGYEPWRAFARTLDASHCWHTTNTTSAHWIRYQFTKSVRITHVSIVDRVGAPTGNVSAILQGSNDGGSTWEDIATLNYTVSNTGERHDFIIENNNSYLIYGLWYNSSPSNYIQIQQLQFYGREKAVQYRATVPTMTSATTPSGVASDSGHYDYYGQYNGWHAFDGTTNRYLSPQNSVNQWIAYEFPEAKTIKKMTIYGTPGANNESVPSVIKTQVKVNDNWIDLDTYNNSSTTLNATRYFENQYSSTNYRISFSGMVESKNFVTIRDLQFYEEVTGDVILHSAANDTIYCIDGENNQMPICTTDENGVGKCDLTSFQAGPITLYSSVAKNPDDLTADYSKTIIITKTQYGGTTEAYLMPDTVKTLYWYGYESDNLEDLSSANGWVHNSRSFGTPTHNTNDIQLTANASNVVGIGVKNQVSPSSAYVITNSVTGGTAFCLDASKNMTSTTSYKNVTVSGSSLTKTDMTSINNSGILYIRTATSSYSAKVNALWYE